MHATVRPSRLFLAVVAIFSCAAQAAPYVEARSSSLAQSGPQPSSSRARVVNGTSNPAENWAGSNGSSHTGGGLTMVWADTTQRSGAVLATTYAAADLNTGSLRVYAEAGAGVTNAIGAARWTDTITFNNASGQALELDFRWQTEGVVTPINSDSSRDVTSSILLSVNNQTVSFIGLKGQSGWTPLGGAQHRQHGSAISPQGVAGFSYQPAGSSEAGAWRTALTGPASGSVAATLRVPAGLSRTCESGVFLCTPVPCAWALLSAGLLVVAADAAKVESVHWAERAEALGPELRGRGCQPRRVRTPPQVRQGARQVPQRVGQFIGSGVINHAQIEHPFGPPINVTQITSSFL